MATIFTDQHMRLTDRLRHGDATLWLIVINIAVWLTAWSVDALVPSHPAEQFLALKPDVRWALHHPWTLMTYMVTHISVLHILFNMLWLYWFGTMSQRTVGSGHLVVAYISGGLVGGLLYLITTAIIRIPIGSDLVGASASVLCIMTATALRTPELEVNLLLAGPIRLKWFALLCILLAMLGLGGGNAGGVIAHIGGVLTGAVIGLRERGTLRKMEFKTRLRINRSKVKRMHTRRQTMAPPLSPGQRLDQLLDKIKVSGYASLSKAERDELSKLSNGL